MEVRGTNLIGNSDSALGNQFFYAVDPKTGSRLPLGFAQSTPDEVNQAVALSHDAWLSGWSSNTHKRVFLLETCAYLIEANAAELMRFYCMESGLPESRAKVELQRSCFQFRSYAKAVQSGYALGLKISTVTSTSPDLRKMLVPLGSVVVFGASNFPFAYSVLGGDVASAFAAGCPVIVKGHPMHPHTGELSARIIRQAVQKHNLPEGVFSYLHAEDYKVGEQLVTHPQVSAVGFTGSIQGGTALQRLAIERENPIPVFAEMGSTNPMVFTPQALLEKAQGIASEVAASISLSAGQFCTSPGLLFALDGSDTDIFVRELSESLGKVAEQVMLHPRIFAQYVKQLEAQLPGAEILVNEKREGNYITPSLIRVNGKQFLKQTLRREEVFGSFAQLIVCSDEQELLNCVNSLPGQLTGSLFCGENEEPLKWMEHLQRKVGRLILNGVPTGVAVSVSMHHGGPFPASSAPATSAVGDDAIFRFSRPVSYQNTPDRLLPEPLKHANPLGFLRFVNGFYTDKAC